MSSLDSLDNMDGIAVIGMAGRFPGAKSIEAFWQNLRTGVSSISFFSDDELLASRVDPARLHDPNYVKAGGILEDVEWFDASVFGINPREATLMDPQHRFFLECAWEALENAGYDPEQYQGSIGVYAGVGMNSYLLNALVSNPQPIESVVSLETAIGNDKDFLSTRVSYKLNLKGPSATVQTACSTSLVAIHLACQSLLNGECEMMLAGGILITVPTKAGYLYYEGGIKSPDGYCRAFDAEAQGTVGGNGVGIVVLKRLADALADGDCIYAVIKGSAINNDGSLKVGYTAPSIEGQAEVIAEALAVAGFEADTVTYVETHGTGTHLGDPVELAALTRAFRASTDKKGLCAIGSVKTNVGHLDAAAGVTGLIKTVLALRHKELPPSLHFKNPNPEIDFANSPFFVNTTLRNWQTDGIPRRAGVSSFGIGGTNVHVALEEAPAMAPSSASRPHQLLVLSARTGPALEQATTNLVEHLKKHPDLDMADVVNTLQLGRKRFSHRRTLVCRDLEDAVDALERLDPKRLSTTFDEATDRPVAFMFPGQGTQYVNMGLELYQHEPVFREQVDLCADLLEPHLGMDVRDVLYPAREKTEAAAHQLRQTLIAQPALFVINYALAQSWMAWGIYPQAMIGHSVGEYVAACLAGVFSVEDALLLLAVRGQLMQGLPGGAMLAISLPVQELEPVLGESLALAAINEPSGCVVSGPTAVVNSLENRLTDRGIAYRRLHTSHAFHSAMMDPVLEPFARQVSKIELNPPQIPLISNVTGSWLTAQEATDPSYWARHLRQTVRFADGLEKLLNESERVLLEVGPGPVLSTLARRHPAKGDRHVIVSSMRHPQEHQSDVVFLLNALGRLWLSGNRVNWSGFYANERRHRLPLPTYPFERQRYWLDLQPRRGVSKIRREALGQKREIGDWFYLPSWKRSIPLSLLEPETLIDQTRRWLVFSDTFGLGEQLVKRLKQMNQDVSEVMAGEQFAQIDDGTYVVNPLKREHYDALIQHLRKQDQAPDAIVHLWGVGPGDDTLPDVVRLEKAQALGFYSLLYLAQALIRQNVTHSLQISVVTSNMQDVLGVEALCPEKATALGPCRVMPQEYSNFTCRSLDIVFPASGTWSTAKIEQLIAEFASKSSDTIVAYRGNKRWVQTFEPVHLVGHNGRPTQLREGGVYLITGGLGGIGLVLAEYLAQSAQAKLVLTGRSGLPAKDKWARWLATHGDQDDVSQKIRKVQALESLGAEILIASADVTNLAQMQGVIEQTVERFGAIHGVFHAAGSMGEETFREIQETNQPECELHFQPKVYGLLVLEQVLRGHPLDFCLLISSLSSILGGLRFVAYSAANLFMDALVRKHNRIDSGPWTSVNWDGWQLKEEKEQHPAFGTAQAELAITPAEGVEAFRRVLSMSPVDQIVVSTGDLQARIDQWIKLEALQEKEQSASGASAPPSTRPALPNSYVAPRNETEQTVAEIWQTFLGIEQVGIYDNFFELGGHSLLAIQIISRLRDAFQVELSLQTILDSQTVADLAGEIERTTHKGDNKIEKLAGLLDLVEQLSEDEVKALLAEQERSPKGRLDDTRTDQE